MVVNNYWLLTAIIQTFQLKILYLCLFATIRNRIKFCSKSWAQEVYGFTTAKRLNSLISGLSTQVSDTKVLYFMRWQFFFFHFINFLLSHQPSSFVSPYIMDFSPTTLTHFWLEVSETLLSVFPFECYSYQCRVCSPPVWCMHIKITAVKALLDPKHDFFSGFMLLVAWLFVICYHYCPCVATLNSLK